MNFKQKFRHNYPERKIEDVSLSNSLINTNWTGNIYIALTAYDGTFIVFIIELITKN